MVVVVVSSCGLRALPPSGSLASLQAGGNQALPHLGVPNISSLDWGALRKAGFKGCVFDKDNTLTEPYAHFVAPQLAASLEECKRQFDGKLVVYSNSAGLSEFDPEGDCRPLVCSLLELGVLQSCSLPSVECRLRLPC